MSYVPPGTDFPGHKEYKKSQQMALLKDANNRITYAALTPLARLSPARCKPGGLPSPIPQHAPPPVRMSSPGRRVPARGLLQALLARSLSQEPHPSWDRAARPEARGAPPHVAVQALQPRPLSPEPAPPRLSLLQGRLGL